MTGMTSNETSLKNLWLIDSDGTSEIPDTVYVRVQGLPHPLHRSLAHRRSKELLFQ
jgi:hypothetical protein